jgi:rod shape-determining protein MreD
MLRHNLITFFSQLLLWALLSQINHYLAVWHLYLFVASLFVTLTALRLPLRDGIYATLCAGLLCDANSPVPFGTHTLLFTLTHALIIKIRSSIPVEQTATQVIIAFVANIALYFALTIILVVGPLQLMPVLPRLIWDLLISQFVLLLIAPWFFALQTSLLSLEQYRARRF